MKSYVPSRAPCPVGRASRVIGDRWALLILREAFLGIDRFEDFMNRLPISRAALTSRLQLLVAAGVLERRPPSGKRAHYCLTPAGLALKPAYDAIKIWGEEWLPAPEGTGSTAYPQ
jgi:DNA-binding HxlR family transcriptional regulator